MIGSHCRLLNGVSVCVCVWTLQGCSVCLQLFLLLVVSPAEPVWHFTHGTNRGFNFTFISMSTWLKPISPTEEVIWRQSNWSEGSAAILTVASVSLHKWRCDKADGIQRQKVYSTEGGLVRAGLKSNISRWAEGEEPVIHLVGGWILDYGAREKPWI